MSGYAVAPTRDLPNIGWDPCPGSPADTRTLASVLSDFATQATEMASFISGRGDNAGKWVGDSFDTFQRSMEDFPPKLVEVANAFDTASTALNGWAEDLDAFQERSWELDGQLRDKRIALDAAQAEVTGWLERGDDPDVVNANVEIRDAAQGEVREVERNIEALHQEYLDKAREYGGRLDAAGDAAWGGSWWDTIKGAWADFTYWLEHSWAGDLARTLAPLADWVSNVGAWVSAISFAAAGVALIIPGAQVAVPVFAAIGSISGAVSTVADGVLAVGGYQDWSFVGVSALRFGVGKVFSGASKKIIQSHRNTRRTNQLVTVTGPGGREHTYVPSLFRMTEMHGDEVVWHAVRLKGSQAKWAITGYGLASSLTVHEEVRPWELPRGAAYVEVGG
ncbi:MAG TPA: hypothetical protein VK024_03545 [Actinomycetaceae bacterium]|nr:hypothetical protein [Actinomycetaceae bacterium]